jgi:hypothetical protein
MQSSTGLHWSRRRWLRGMLAMASVAACPRVQAQEVNAGPYVPTPQHVVERMLRMAAVNDKDFIVDLGSGDGRIVITAARQFGARGLGVDISEQLVDQATTAAHRERVADRVQFLRQDAFKTDIREASVLTLYLLPNILLELRPRLLAQLKPGARIVSHDYNLGDWESDHAVVLDTPEKEVINGTTKTSLFLYVVPAHVAGTWQIRLPGPDPSPTVDVSLQQSFQRISGNTVGNDAQELSAANLRGDRIELGLPLGRNVLSLKGRVVGERIEGVVEGRGRSRSGFSAIRVASGKAMGWE